MTGYLFNEEKPAKTMIETLERTKVKAKQIGGDIFQEVKSIDTAAIKAKIGGFWNKLRGREQEPTPDLQSHDLASEQSHDH